MDKLSKMLDVDQKYCQKFGHLKKGSVLFNYGRINEAHEELATGIKIIQQQKIIEEERLELIMKRWKFKLGLDEGFELGIPLDKVHPDEITDKELQAADMGPGVTVATLRLFIEHCSPFRRDAYSKDAYLNHCLEDLYT